MKSALLCVIVDDDPDWIDLARRCLARSRLKLKVSTFRKAAEALAFVGGREVGVVVTDLRMPEMDGLEFVRALRVDGCQAPVVMIASDETAEPDARRAGVEAFVVKGHLASDLCPSVERAATAGVGATQLDN